MTCPFGFSVGDFIAGISLLHTLVSALREHGDAREECGELLHELEALEAALMQVQQLVAEDTKKAENLALRQGAAQCQETIHEFGQRLHKAQGCGWTRVKWALSRKEDIAKFCARIIGRTEAIRLLLTVVQM